MCEGMIMAVGMKRKAQHIAYRGGSWSNSLPCATVALRYPFTRDIFWDNLGLRLIIIPDGRGIVLLHGHE